MNYFEFAKLNSIEVRTEIKTSSVVVGWRECLYIETALPALTHEGRCCCLYAVCHFRKDFGNIWNIVRTAHVRRTLLYLTYKKKPYIY